MSKGLAFNKIFYIPIFCATLALGFFNTILANIEQGALTPPMEVPELERPLQKYRVVKVEWKHSDIDAVLQKIQEFSIDQARCSTFKEAKIKLDAFLEVLNNLCPSNDIPEEIMDKLGIAITVYAKKYHDDLLKENGLFLSGSYPGGYTVYFETSKRYWDIEFPWFTEYRHLRFKISKVDWTWLSFDDLTNVVLVLQNKEGFEVARTTIGTIKKYGWATGELELKEEDYQQIAKAFLITDQDR